MSGKCYNKNFIKQVIAKIEFGSPVEVFSPETISEAVKEIKKRFPISEQSTGTRQSIQISPSGVSSAAKDEYKEWVFHGNERNKILKVNKLWIEVLLTKYISYDDFQNDLVIPISHLLKIDSKIVINRTGVRFVNIFDFPIDDVSSIKNFFAKYISNNIVGISKKTKLTRSILIQEFVIGDIKLRQQTGLFNPDYPAPIMRNHFLIDLDAFIDSPHQIIDASDHFKELHNVIENQFESLITKRLRDEVLNGKS